MCGWVEEERVCERVREGGVRGGLVERVGLMEAN